MDSAAAVIQNGKPPLGQVVVPVGPIGEVGTTLLLFHLIFVPAMYDGMDYSRL